MDSRRGTRTGSSEIQTWLAAGHIRSPFFSHLPATLVSPKPPTPVPPGTTAS